MQECYLVDVFLDNHISFRPLYNQNSYYLLVSFLYAVSIFILKSILLGKHVPVSQIWKLRFWEVTCPPKVLQLVS